MPDGRLRHASGIEFTVRNKATRYAGATAGPRADDDR